MKSFRHKFVFRADFPPPFAPLPFHTGLELFSFWGKDKHSRLYYHMGEVLHAPADSLSSVFCSMFMGSTPSAESPLRRFPSLATTASIRNI